MLDPLIGIRTVHLAATAMTAGAVFFAMAVARPALRDEIDRFSQRVDRWVWAGLIVIVSSGAAWALLLTTRIGDAGIVEVLRNGTFATLMTETQFGQVLLVRATLAVFTALLMCSKAVRFRSIAAACAIAMLTAVAWLGHSGAGFGIAGAIQLAADIVHLLAAGFWLGGLPALALLIATSDGLAATAAIKRFSLLGMAAVAALLVSGAVNGFLLTGEIAGLTSTLYGRLLLLKIALFAAMVALAALNRWSSTPRLPTREAAGAIRRNAIAELALGLCAVAVVGALGTLPPPNHRHAHTNEPAFVHLHGDMAMADVTLEPSRAGPTELRVRLMREDFTPLAAKEVSVRLSNRKAGIESIVRSARSDEPGYWRANDIVLPVPGIWTVEIDASVTDFGNISLDGPIVVEP